MHDATLSCPLRPELIIAPAEELTSHFDALERRRAGAAAADASSWMAETTIGDWGDGEERFGTQASKAFVANAPGAALGEPLRACCACMLDSVQSQLRERLVLLRSALEVSLLTRTLELQMSVTMLLSRTPSDGEYRGELIHADAFDGTVLGLAFVCSKMGTRLFQDAVFVEAPVKQFARESRSGKRNGFSRVVDGAQGDERVLQPGMLLIMPAAVAHARPDGKVCDHDPPAGPRWFARAHLELRPVGGRRAWSDAQRMQVALLVAEHVWRDAAFLAAATAEVRATEGSGEIGCTNDA